MVCASLAVLFAIFTLNSLKLRLTVNMEIIIKGVILSFYQNIEHDFTKGNLISFKNYSSGIQRDVV